MKFRLIFSIVVLGFALGYAARLIEDKFFSSGADFDPQTQLLDEKSPDATNQ